LRIKRIELRDNSFREDILKRINNQWPAEKIRPLADWVIENDDKNLILPQILNIHLQILQKISIA
jgi:dephospho-CoA kinase